jgi:anti-sigma factor RsiW
MTRFSDELLSAYLDGEATADERAAVEAHLATSEPDRRLLEELQALRGEMQALPKATVDEGFADRVVKAAVAAKARGDAQIAPASSAPAKRSRQWTYWTAAVALGLAVCAVVVIQNWPAGNGTNENIVVAPYSPERLIEDLYRAAPAEGEAVVLRLQVPKNAPLGQMLDVALAEAGLAQRPAFDVGSGAIQLGAAFRQQFGAKPPEETVAVSDALYVDASLEQIETALKALAADGERKLHLVTETRLALAKLPPIDGAEGEPGSASIAGPFCQRLNAGMFKLAKQAAAAVTEPGAAPPKVDRTRSVKILLLIEPVE